MDDRTFVDILRDRAQHSGDKIAYRFLVSGDKQESTLTYGQLHQRALAIAAVLRDEAKPGDRVLLLYPPGLEFICAFFGCLYAGVIAVPAYPLGNSRLVQNVKRLELLSQNCTPAVVLCDDRIQAVFEERITADIQKSVLQDMNGQPLQQNNSLALSQAKVISTSNVLDVVSERMIVTSLSKDLAFLQYTSGSTGNPKGVMVSHGNLMENSEYIKYAHNHTPRSVIVSWLPQYHDMGFIGCILQPVFVDCLGVFFPPTLFMQQPILWLDIISRYKATTSGGPNFSYELCCNSFDVSLMSGISLSSWCAATSGAEPIRKETMERFSRIFEPYGFNPKAFFPLYGMAEHTLMVSAGILGKGYQTLAVDPEQFHKNNVVESSNEKLGLSFVGCGKSLQQHVLDIVDPEEKVRLRDRLVGEIWCHGPSVAQGYWGNKKATNEIFNAYTQDGQGPFLRTGDLGFLKDGELYIVGRLKDMIIICGRNHAPQDIEYSVENSHIGIRQGCVAAFSYEKEGVEKLAVVCEIKRTYIKKDHNEIIQSVIEKIARENELSVSLIVLLKPGQIFKTTSGKIQRRKNKNYLNRDIPVLYRYLQEIGNAKWLERGKLSPCDYQQRLNMIISSVAGRPIDKLLDNDLPLTDFGLDSLMLVELQNRIEMEFIDDVDMDEVSLSTTRTYNELLSYLKKNKIPMKV